MCSHYLSGRGKVSGRKGERKGRCQEWLFQEQQRKQLIPLSKCPFTISQPYFLLSWEESCYLPKKAILSSFESFNFFSWHAINHSKNKMLPLASKNIRKRERNIDSFISFKRWRTSFFRDMFFSNKKSARPGDEPDSPSPKVINQKIYFTVERTGFSLDGLFYMSSHHAQQDPSYLPDFVSSLSSLSGSPTLSVSWIFLSWSQNCPSSMEVTKVLHICHHVKDNLYLF